MPAENSVPANDPTIPTTPLVLTPSSTFPAIRLRKEDQRLCEQAGGGELLCRFASGSLTGACKVNGLQTAVDHQPTAIETMLAALEFIDADNNADYRLATYLDGGLFHVTAIQPDDRASLAALARLISEQFHLLTHRGAEYELLTSAQQILNASTDARS